MMRMYFVKKRDLLIACCLLVIGLGVLSGQAVLTSSSLGYQKSQAFPPLVYLPGYQQGPPIHASAAVLIEADSSAVLFSKRHDLRRAPASTTKMMTAIVALEKGDLSKEIRVSPLAARTPGSTIWLRPGDRLSLKELLEGMMLCSGNDGSMAVAEGVAGNVNAFVTLMNLKAKEIGAINTSFKNPHGLRAPSHYTTALDLALIARYAMANPRFAQLVSKKTATLTWSDDQNKAISIQNTNRLLWYLEGADGIKTGTTNEAGRCLVASACREGRRFIAVVLNSGDRWGDCARLLEYGFKDFKVIKLACREQAGYRLRLKKAKSKWVNLYPRNDLTVVIPSKASQKLQRQIVIYAKEPVSPPLAPGQVLGRISFHYGGKLVEATDLIMRQRVKVHWWLW